MSQHMKLEDFIKKEIFTLTGASEFDRPSTPTAEMIDEDFRISNIPYGLPESFVTDTLRKYKEHLKVEAAGRESADAFIGKREGLMVFAGCTYVAEERYIRGCFEIL